MRSNPLKISSLGITALALFAISCSDTTLGTFSVDEALPKLEIPSIGIQIPLSLAIPVRLDLTTQEAYENGDFDYVTSVKVLSLDLNIDPASDADSIEDGNLDDFDFINALEVYLSAKLPGDVCTNHIEGIITTGDHTCAELVASVPEGDPQYASGTRTLTLTTTNIDIFDYIEAPEGYNMVVKVSGITPIDSVIVTGSVRYRVGVGFR